MLTPKVTAITHTGPSPYAPMARQSGPAPRVAGGSSGWAIPRGG